MEAEQDDPNLLYKAHHLKQQRLIDILTSPAAGDIARVRRLVSTVVSLVNIISNVVQFSES